MERTTRRALHYNPRVVTSFNQQTEGAPDWLPKTNLMPGANEVVAAIESLYVDQLQPVGRLLRKRIAERFRDAFKVHVDGPFTHIPDVDFKYLRSVCEACKDVNITVSDGGEWYALLTGHETHFVDVHSSNDPYPEEMWEQAHEYFQSLREEEMFLPGGRYACAQALIDRGLTFLKGYSLGRVCHIVQLAISHRKILGYINGAVVPYGRSRSKVKECCANAGAPIVVNRMCGTTAEEMPVAEWHEARVKLVSLLEDAASTQGRGSIPLSNVKRLFRSRFRLELSETMLGYAKLSELLQDPRFSDICEVRLQGQGYMVVQRDHMPPPAAATWSSRRKSSKQSPPVQLVPTPRLTPPVTQRDRVPSAAAATSNSKRNSSKQSPPGQLVPMPGLKPQATARAEVAPVPPPSQPPPAPPPALLPPSSLCLKAKLVKPPPSSVDVTFDGSSHPSTSALCPVDEWIGASVGQLRHNGWGQQTLFI